MWLSITMLAVSDALGQSVNNHHIEVSYNKTTSVVFPFAITSVDRGSRDILAQKANGVENVLQLKAGLKEFPETNLTVITADGKLHHFTVNYAEETDKQTVTIVDTREVREAQLMLARNAVNARHVKQLCDQVISEPAAKVKRDKEYGMVLTLGSIHVSGDFLLYRIQIRNKSAIEYDVKSLKFYIRDKKKMKRTSCQEIEAVPVFVANEKQKVGGYGSTDMVFVLRKFTIPDGKALHIELFEQNGGRNLTLKLSNSDILKAELIKVNEHLLTINK